MTITAYVLSPGPQCPVIPISTATNAPGPPITVGGESYAIVITP
jgi:hypothetical protein